jgi:hypothetical protein
VSPAKYTHIITSLPCFTVGTTLAEIYLPPQTDAGTKKALNELYKAISKQENAHPEAALLVAGDFNAGKFKYIFTSFLPAC